MARKSFTPSVVLRVAGVLAIASAARAAAADDSALPALPQNPPAAAAPNPEAGPTTEPAQAAIGTDVVHLKGGGLMRGTIVETTAGVQVRIRLATGEVATVPWGNVERIDSVAVNAERPHPRVLVHVDSELEARVQQDTTGDDDWVTVCQSPCDKELSTEYWYRVVGDGIRASADFALRGTPRGRETLRIEPASQAAHTVGLILIPIGLVSAYSSLFVLEVALLDSVSSQDSNAGTIGWIMLGGGALVATLGLVMVRSNSKSAVSQWGVVPRAARSAPTAWLTAPSWKEASAESKAWPVAFGLPIVTGHF